MTKKEKQSVMMNGWLEVEYCNDNNDEGIETAIITDTFVPSIELSKFGFNEESYFKKGAKVWFMSGKQVDIDRMTTKCFLKEKDVIKIEIEVDDIKINEKNGEEK